MTSFNVYAEARLLAALPMNELRARYLTVWGDPTRSGNRVHLIRRILWRMQEQRWGGLGEAPARRAEEIGRNVGVRVRPPRASVVRSAAANVVREKVELGRQPAIRHLPETEIVREYKGRRLVVQPVAGGFRFEGRDFRSLSAVAKHVTGSHWNGPAFFGVGRGTGGAR
ncbi:MAG: DUF2924 domain-containing protein [Phycisphaerales bacterium]